MKKYFVCLLIFISTTAKGQIDTVGPMNVDLINAVVEIKNSNGFGSGFLVSTESRKFLVTNKHMIGNWSPVDSLLPLDSIFISLYSNNGTIYKALNIAENGKLIKSKIIVHPNPKIDIAVIDITKDIMNLNLGRTNFFDTSFLLSIEEAKKILTYGSKVFIIGYPNGIKSYNTNEPLVKAGHLASSLDGKLEVEQVWINRNKKNVRTVSEGKIFIVDGLIISGNSGGPVVMSQEVTWISVNGEYAALKNPQNLILGIVSNSYSNTGLTVVFSSNHIREVIKMFK
jgi:S1-C subfamily serine protease